MTVKDVEDTLQAEIARRDEAIAAGKATIADLNGKMARLADGMQRSVIDLSKQQDDISSTHGNTLAALDEKLADEQTAHAEVSDPERCWVGSKPPPSPLGLGNNTPVVSQR